MLERVLGSPRHATTAAVLVAAAYAGVLALLQWVPRYDCIVFVAAAALVFRLLDGASPRGRALALHAVTQLFAAAFLVHLWVVGYEGRNVVFGGILPWSDSHDFYNDALRLVHGERFTEISSKRPLFSAALGALLKVSGGDLRFALVVCAVVGAWATALAALEVWKTHGFRSALVVYLVVLFFERRWTGFVQTEHVGLPMGVIGFALFWRAQRRDGARARSLALAGLFAMTLGLMARAGAFFALPALALWGARRLTSGARREQARFLALAAAAVLLGFFVHRGVLAATGRGVTFSDYPGIFYGLMHGEDYTYLVQTHPHLGALPVDARVPESWRIVTSEARQDPMLVVTGFAKSGAGLFTSPYGIFSYVWTNPDDHVLEDAVVVRQAMRNEGLLGPLWHWRRTLGTYSLLNAGAMGALGAALVLSTAWAIVALVRRRRDPDLSLLRHVIAGVLLSAPFTPPWITSGQQVQTVTLSFVAAVPAVVLLGRRRDLDDDPAAEAPWWRVDPLRLAPPAFAVALAALVAWMRFAPSEVPPCDGQAHVVRLFPGTQVEVASTRTLSFRAKGLADLETSIRFLAKHNGMLTRSITPTMRVGTVYASAFDACDRRAKIVIDEARGAGLVGTSTWRAIDAEPLETPAVLRLRSGAQRPVEP